MTATLLHIVRDDSGATAVEYGLIAGLIAAIMVTSVTTVVSKLSNSFTNVSNRL